MSELISKALRGSFGDRFASHVSMSGDAGYNSATAIWPKPVGRIPRAVVHCLTPEDVQSAIRAAHDCDLPLSVRGGGHDWMGRALCDGIVIDLSRMNGIAISADGQSALVSGGARGRSARYDRSARTGCRDRLDASRRHGRTHSGWWLRTADRPLRTRARQSAVRPGGSRRWTYRACGRRA
jgi:hypothetical protein